MKSFLSITAIILICMSMILTGCSKKAAVGDKVKVHYTGTLEDGTVFDSSVGQEPLEVVIGKTGLIKGFSDALIGMKVGDVKNISIPPEEAYGPYRPEMVMVAPRDQVPEDVTLEVGRQLQFDRPGGGIAIATITELTDSTVTIDGNHPLAGKTLNFEIEMVEIGEDTTATEPASGDEGP